jgi:regulator of sigma E protease
VDFPAYEAGIRPGDRIVRIDGAPIRFWVEMTHRVDASGGEPIEVSWISGETGELQTATLVPRIHDVDERFLMGIQLPTEPMLADYFGAEHRRFGLGGAAVAGVQDTWVNTGAIMTSLRRVFTGRDDFRENVGGPIMIAKITKEAAERGAETFWFIVAMLSITLAIMNILPIPALDGGHLMFLIYEGITRREPSLRVRMAMQQVGFILLLAFMTFVIFNDILRF